jgi:tyrosine ammonia-lyase
MGTIAARMAAEALSRASEIQAILALCVAQAIDIVEEHGAAGFSPAARALREFVRARSAAVDIDRPLGKEIAAMAEAMRHASPPPGP